MSFRAHLNSVALPITDGKHKDLILSDKASRLFTMLLEICDVRYLVRLHVTTTKFSKTSNYIEKDFNDFRTYYAGIYYIIRTILESDEDKEKMSAVKKAETVETFTELFKCIHKHFISSTPERQNAKFYNDTLSNSMQGRAMHLVLDNYKPKVRYDWSTREVTLYEKIIEYHYLNWNRMKKMPYKISDVDNAHKTEQFKILVSTAFTYFTLFTI